MKYKLKNNQEIYIRECTVDDADVILEYMKKVNSETKNLTREPDEFTMTVEQERDFLERAVNSEHQHMATAWLDDELICCAGIHGNGLKRLRHKVSLGISVLMKYHGLGVGTVMMEYLLLQAKKMNKTKVELDVRADNPGAIHVYEKVGFKHEGVRERGFYVDGKYVDLVLMGINL